MSNSPAILNQRISNLYGLIAQISGGVPTTSDLSVVLGNGNDATGQDIINLNSLATNAIIDNGTGLSIDNSSTGDLNIGTSGSTENINIVASDSIALTAVNNDINLDTPNGVVNINGVPYPPAVDTLQVVLTAGNTAQEPLTIVLNDNAGNIFTTTSSASFDVEFDDGITPNSASYQRDGVYHSGDSLSLNTNGVIGFNSTNLFANSAGLDITSSIANSIPAPNLEIINNSTTAGTTNGVPSVQYYKSGRNGANNDIICSQSFNAKNSTGVKTEFAKIETLIRNVGVGNDDGSIGIFATLNGVSTEFMRINGADGDNNFLRPLDMNGSAINSSSGNLSISASSSSGTGNLTLTPKPLSNLIFQNLPTSAVGLPTGAVWDNLGVLNIAP
jgi:hypothetical protein